MLHVEEFTGPWEGTSAACLLGKKPGNKRTDQSCGVFWLVQCPISQFFQLSTRTLQWMKWICSVMVSFPVFLKMSGFLVLQVKAAWFYFYFYFFKGCLRVKKGRKAVLSLGHFLRASQIYVTVLLLGNFWGWGKECILKLGHFFMGITRKQEVTWCWPGHIHCTGRSSAVLSCAPVLERAFKTPLSWCCVLWAPGWMASPPLLPWLPGSSNSSACNSVHVPAFLTSQSTSSSALC